jgi:hypothetical protein
MLFGTGKDIGLLSNAALPLAAFTESDGIGAEFGAVSDTGNPIFYQNRADKCASAALQKNRTGLGHRGEGITKRNVARSRDDTCDLNYTGRVGESNGTADEEVVREGYCASLKFQIAGATGNHVGVADRCSGSARAVLDECNSVESSVDRTENIGVCR